MKTQLYAACFVAGILMASASSSAVADPVLPESTILQQMGQAQAEASFQAAWLARVKKQAAQIKIGSSRALIDKMFPLKDGGLMSYNLSRYYVGDGVMVDVPYDDYGGSNKPQNRVRGSGRVYLSAFHTD